ncbi:MAG TPA: tripartite tricarboxylate transporter TctB family protein [Anaeromyxobacter sp.]|nr:tripartite tricarboxylate transporter TctB family protein [Anaeromyxobacter sp.]
MTDGSPGVSPSPDPSHGRRVRAPQNLVAGLSLIALALFAWGAGAGLETGTLRSMGPGMLPRTVTLLVGLTGAALVVLSLVKAGDPLGRWPLRGPFFVALAVVAFALSIRTVGLAVAGPLVALMSGGASPETRWKELLVFAIVITAFCIGLFRYALHLPIPILVLPGFVI